MEEADKQDIFAGDRNFSEEERPKIEEKSFKAGFSNLGEGIGHIFKGFWHIFSKKFQMNVLILLLIIALVCAGLYYMWPAAVISQENMTDTLPVQMIFPSSVDTSLLPIEEMESTIAEKCLKGLDEELIISCEETECPICEGTPECPECICDSEAIAVEYYQCLDGVIKEKKSECNRLPLGLATKDYAVDNGFMLALNKVGYNLSDVGEYDGTITFINFSVYNAAGYDIKPKLKLYLFDVWSNDEVFKKVIDFDDRAIHSSEDSNEGITWTETANLYFLKKENKMLLQLMDVNKEDEEILVELETTISYT